MQENKKQKITGLEKGIIAALVILFALAIFQLYFIFSFTATMEQNFENILEQNTSNYREFMQLKADFEASREK